MQLWQDVMNILKAPVAGNLSVQQLFLLIGLVIVFSIAWIIVLEHMRSVVSEI